MSDVARIPSHVERVAVLICKLDLGAVFLVRLAQRGAGFRPGKNMVVDVYQLDAEIQPVSPDQVDGIIVAPNDLLVVACKSARRVIRDGRPVTEESLIDLATITAGDYLQFGGEGHVIMSVLPTTDDPSKFRVIVANSPIAEPRR